MEEMKVSINTDNQEELYTLYIHTCLENDKVYVGITSKDAKDRWLDSESYKGNSDLYSDIKKYGWDNGFHHKIVADNLVWEKAKESEKFFIQTFDSTNPEKGYNHRKGNNRQGISRERANIGTKSKFCVKTKLKTNLENIVEQMVDGIVGKESENPTEREIEIRKNLSGRALEYLMFIDDDKENEQ